MTKIVELLNESMVSFEFVKSDGSLRKAVGTTNIALIPAEHQPKSDTSNVNGDVVSYYDNTVSGWRSFRKDSIKEDSIKVVE